jgi:hypothetical protein
MKKLLLAAVLALGLGANAQSINGINVSEIDSPFVELLGTGKMFSNKVTVEMDFGQNNKYWSSKDTRVLDENGKDVVFNSMVDAMNFMSRNGYKFEAAYVVSIPSGMGGYQNVYHWLMSKISKNEKI